MGEAEGDVNEARRDGVEEPRESVRRLGRLAARLQGELSGWVRLEGSEDGERGLARLDEVAVEVHEIGLRVRNEWGRERGCVGRRERGEMEIQRDRDRDR